MSLRLAVERAISSSCSFRCYPTHTLARRSCTLHYATMASQPPLKKQKLATGSAAKPGRASASKRFTASPSTSPPRGKGKGRSVASEPGHEIAITRTDSPDCPTDRREWPASPESMSDPRRFLQDAVSYLTNTSTPIQEQRPLVIVPDKDADGLSAGQILRRTLLHLGAPDELLRLHLMSKGTNPASREEREKLADFDAAYIVVLDQGSRDGPGIVPAGEAGWDNEDCHTKTMVLDHHFLEKGQGPKGALVSCSQGRSAWASTDLRSHSRCYLQLTTTLSLPLRSSHGCYVGRSGEVTRHPRHLYPTLPRTLHTFTRARPSTISAC